jgi:hypothetical protein
MAFFVAPELAHPSLQRHETRSGFSRAIGMPTQLLCRRMIELAFSDALQCGADGQPTERARDAWMWLSAKLDWTLREGPIPPEDARQEFYGSFEWACAWLSEDPDVIRAQGLPPPPAMVLVKHRRAREWVRGLADVARQLELRASRVRRA